LSYFPPFFLFLFPFLFFFPSPPLSIQPHRLLCSLALSPGSERRGSRASARARGSERWKAGLRGRRLRRVRAAAPGSEGRGSRAPARARGSERRKAGLRGRRLRRARAARGRDGSRLRGRRLRSSGAASTAALSPSASASAELLLQAGASASAELLPTAALLPHVTSARPPHRRVPSRRRRVTSRARPFHPPRSVCPRAPRQIVDILYPARNSGSAGVPNRIEDRAAASASAIRSSSTCLAYAVQTA
jgi:hypothetical protein